MTLSLFYGKCFGLERYSLQEPKSCNTELFYIANLRTLSRWKTSDTDQDFSGQTPKPASSVQFELKSSKTNVVLFVVLVRLAGTMNCAIELLYET